MLRIALHDAFDQVAVRIDEHEPLAGFDIGENEPLEQGRLTRAGLADDVHVREPIRLLDAENPPIIAGIGACEIRNPASVMGRWVSSPPSDGRGAGFMLPSVVGV